MTNSKVAKIKAFSLETTEDNEDLTKVRVTAEIILDCQNVLHIDANEVKVRLQQAVKDAVCGMDRCPALQAEGGRQ